MDLSPFPGLRFLFSGRSLLVTGAGGSVESGREGLFVHGTRVLSRHEIRCDGSPVLVFATSPVEAAGSLAYAHITRDPESPRAAVHLEVERFLGDGLRERIRVEERGLDRSLKLRLEVRLGADFADTREAARGDPPKPTRAAWDRRRRVLTFRDRRLERDVRIRVSWRGTVSWKRRRGALVFAVRMRPGATETIELAIEPTIDGASLDAPPASFEPATPLARVRRRQRDSAPRLVSTNTALARAWSRAIEDISSLALGLPGGPLVPAAGIPRFQALFGRDTMITARLGAMALPDLVPQTVELIASHLGTRVDDWRDEAPGKTIHQLCDAPLSILGEDPFDRYYGDHAGPAHFLLLLATHAAWIGDRPFLVRMRPAMRRVLDWFDRYGVAGGLLTYRPRSSRGLSNQGWKDSYDAIRDVDGAIVEPPIATVELQGYWYAALVGASHVLRALGEHGEAAALRRKAAAVRARIDERFWMEEAGFYALAIGPGGKRIDSIASNAGHLLLAGVPSRSRTAAVIARLLAPDLFGGWGVRTLSSEHPSFDPFAYHRGSVWPAENAAFALGLARHGAVGALHALSRALLDALDLFVDGRMPEALGGIGRDDVHPHPGVYPECNPFQSWSAAGTIAIVEALLGLTPLAMHDRLDLDPHLPPWLPDLELRALRVGTSTVDLAFRRERDGSTRTRVLRVDGPVRVRVRSPRPEPPGRGAPQPRFH